MIQKGIKSECLIFSDFDSQKEFEKQFNDSEKIKSIRVHPKFDSYRIRDAPQIAVIIFI